MCDALLCASMLPRSWATGINRVSVWSFDNMYSEATCWEAFRFHKVDMPYLLAELALSNGSPDWSDGMIHTAERFKFEPMEALVVFLARLAYPYRWGQLLTLLGGRSPTAYKSAFKYVLNHIFDSFADRINDVSRWSAQAAEFADAIGDLSLPRKDVLDLWMAPFMDGKKRSETTLHFILFVALPFSRPLSFAPAAAEARKKGARFFSLPIYI